MAIGERGLCWQDIWPTAYAWGLSAAEVLCADALRYALLALANCSRRQKKGTMKTDRRSAPEVIVAHKEKPKGSDLGFENK